MSRSRSCFPTTPAYVHHTTTELLRLAAQNSSRIPRVLVARALTFPSGLLCCLILQGKIGPKTKLSDVVTVREPKEEVPDVPAPEVNLAAFPPAPSMPAYSM